MKCNFCIEKEKKWWKWNGEIECAFINWEFNENNWNCWTLDFLREKVENNSYWNEDIKAWIMPYFIKNKKYDDIWYIYLEWYKSRWTTDKCIDMNTLKPLTLYKALKIIKNL